MAAHSSTQIPSKKRGKRVVGHKTLAAHDFGPWPDCVPDHLEFHKYNDDLERFSITLRLAIATLGKTKVEVIDLAHDLEDNQLDGGVEGLVERMKRARGLLQIYGRVLDTAQDRLLVARHNVYAPNGARLDRTEPGRADKQA